MIKTREGKMTDLLPKSCAKLRKRMRRRELSDRNNTPNEMLREKRNVKKSELNMESKKVKGKTVGVEVQEETRVKVQAEKAKAKKENSAV